MYISLLFAWIIHPINCRKTKIKHFFNRFRSIVRPAYYLKVNTDTQNTYDLLPLKLIFGPNKQPNYAKGYNILHIAGTASKQREEKAGVRNDE